MALETGGGHMCPFERVLRVAIVARDIVLRRRPTSFVVTVVAGDPARCRLERVSVIIEMTRCAGVSDGMRVGEVSRRRSDGYAESLIASVPLDMASLALDLVVFADEGEFGVRVVEVVLDRGTPYLMPTGGRMATGAGTFELAPMFIFVTRFAGIELERRESHHQPTLPCACGLVTLRAFSATVTAGQTVTRSRVVESVGVLPGDFRVTLLAAAVGELIDVGVIPLVAGRALGTEAQQGPIQ